MASDFSLEKARLVLSRAVDKTEELRQAGTFIAVDTSGSPVSMSRMDGCAPGALPIVRAKAFGAAVNGEPSASFAARMAKFSAGIFASYQAVMREQPFPGGGAVLVQNGDKTVGAIATGLGIGPFVKLPGIHPSALIVDGKPANLEDLVISYALDVPYSAQHGDDMARWVDAYGARPDSTLTGTGLSPAPLATGQIRLRDAHAIADYAMAEASAKGVKIAVAIVDAGTDPITLDRMDGASPMGVDVASAVAATAVNFGVPSDEVARSSLYANSIDRLLDSVPYRMLALAGGYPISMRDGTSGAIGIYCYDIVQAHQIAQDAANWATLNLKEYADAKN